MKVIIFAGTRPEAIKMAPVAMALQDIPGVESLLCATGQHKQMLRQAFADFALVPHIDLAVMTTGQSLGALASLLFQKIDALLAEIAPDWVLVQGDTTTAIVAALCAFYKKIRVGHVEAGLRSHHKHAPFPEEINRKMVSVVADLHFAPTSNARKNLLREGVPPTSIMVTGNTVVDALLWMRQKVKQETGLLSEDLEQALVSRKHMVMITGHRRENFGKRLEDICLALRMLAETNPDTLFLYPVHLNPQVEEPVRRLLSGHPGILLTAPLSYKPFVYLMEAASLILTDSGGIQEEAAVLGKPILVMRETTERPEGVAAGAARLVGTDTESIVRGVSDLLASPDLRRQMSSAGTNLYGNGTAAMQIARAVVNNKIENCRTNRIEI